MHNLSVYRKFNLKNLTLFEPEIFDEIPEYKELIVPIFEDGENLRFQKLNPWNSLMHVWINEMVELDNPIREFVALFWHHLIPSQNGKLLDHGKLLLENYRENGLGNVKNLLVNMAANPAMMYYLDAHWSHKDNPNENFPRELFEIFTLGEGNYSLNDIKEASRAFTGRRFDHSIYPYQLFIDKNAFDNGIKNVLGKKGNFNGEDIIDIILSKKECARHIVKAIIKFFITTEIEVSRIIINEATDVYFYSNYNMQIVLQYLFTHSEFNKSRYLNSKVKTPVELLVYLQRQTGLRIKNIKTTINFLKYSGQELFNPPNVGGWPYGKNWFKGQQVLHRKYLSTALLAISNRMIDRNSAVYKLYSRINHPNLKSLRYFADCNFNEEILYEVLNKNNISLSKWLLNEDINEDNLEIILQNSKYQYC